MDNKFYIDDFERYLRDKADEFKMYPSKRVWNSIYNDMHPGSRWPSISMCIVLIGTLFLVGFLNTNTARKSSNPALVNKINTQTVPVYNSLTDSLDKSLIAAGEKNITPEHSASATLNGIAVTGLKNNSLDNSLVNATPYSQSNSKDVNTLQVNNHSGNTIPLIISSTQKENPTTAFGSQLNNNSFAIAAGSGEIILSEVENKLLAANNSTAGIFQPGVIERNNYYEDAAAKKLSDLQLTDIHVKALTTDEELIKNIPADTKLLSEEDKFWIENYALYNRPAPKKWKGKLSWQAYITPSVVYRLLENSAAGKNIGLTALYSNSDINNSVIHTPSLGIEIGTGLQYDLGKKLKIKTGVQLNFTRYNAHAFDNGHPIATSLTMLDNSGDMAYEVYRISPYNSANGITPVKLHNQTFQVSLPVGADYKIASADNLEWYAGASIQPTFVLAGRSYLISTDRRNYVKEADMLNRFNLNAGFETFIAIKAKGITWQIGPQFRKQIFSTNSKVYSIEERLLNYGLKIGITKKL
jgi:hypothetical protein